MAGGTAIADYYDMNEAHKITETALNQYGKVDIVINNAGNTWDASFKNMT